MKKLELTKKTIEMLNHVDVEDENFDYYGLNKDEMLSTDATLYVDEAYSGNKFNDLDTLCKRITKEEYGNEKYLIVKNKIMKMIENDLIKIVEYSIPKFETKKEQLKAVKEDGRNIQYIKNPDRDILIEAVEHTGWSIMFIDNPDKELQLIAVKQNGYFIQDIKNPDKDVQLEAVKQNKGCIECIETPCKKVLEYCNK